MALPWVLPWVLDGVLNSMLLDGFRLLDGSIVLQCSVVGVSANKVCHCFQDLMRLCAYSLTQKGFQSTLSPACLL